MTHILVTGSKGQLGSEIRELTQEYAGYKFTFTDVEELDLTDSKAVDAFFRNRKFDFCIHCAAYTAVDKAEDEAPLARSVNVESTRHLARLCKSSNTFLIHLSTDYVFDGMQHRPYLETDPTGPASVYGMTKLESEQAIADSGAGHVIIRTSWLYSTYGHNFMKTMMRLGAERQSVSVVADQAGTPTYAGDLAAMILNLLQRFPRESPGEIFHYSNEGIASWFDFACAVMELGNTNCKVVPIETKDYPTRASRPAYSVLNKEKIKKQFGIGIPYWRDSLKMAIDKMKTKISNT